MCRVVYGPLSVGSCWSFRPGVGGVGWLEGDSPDEHVGRRLRRRTGAIHSERDGNDLGVQDEWSLGPSVSIT